MLRHWFNKKIQHRREYQQRKAVLNQYGWDGKCSGCHRWQHRHDLVVKVRESKEHFHYLCQCGKATHWLNLGIVLIHDPRKHPQTSSVSV